ncbi:TerD family protein [Nocardia neocaledoniensis]|uniref:TerD family protein n=1 Tax=Nocardia neocaledoniensis TaxID=236511 RepID=UPI002454D71D|nr:TerD family protein [Nocardia neocaledoniensis]
MTPPTLLRGQNLPLPADANRVEVIIGWADSSTEVDASALLLGADGKVGSDADFVFYNQPRSADGSVRFEGTERAGGATRARIVIDLPTVPDHVNTVALASSVSVGSFGALGDLTFEILDDAGRSLAQYVTSDATTERAFVFGEVYRRGGAWKVRAVGQGWDSGLAGLATDFDVEVDDEAEAELLDRTEPASVPVAQELAHEVGSPYRLWGPPRSWRDHELEVADEHLPAIRSLLPDPLPDDRPELTPEVELIPEPSGSRGPWAISVRVERRTIGYLDAETALSWAGPIRRIIASGFIPTTSGRIWYSEYDGWDGTEARASVQLGLGEACDAIPLNEPPTVPYTILPRSAIVQVTREHEHFDVLQKFVPAGGHGVLIVTLHENAPEAGKAKPHVEVRVANQRVGQLTPQMSQRFAPLIHHLERRGLVTACWGDITGSAVAAKVRIDSIKANEASPAVLDGPAVTSPRLCQEMSDPLSYDLTAAMPALAPLPLVQPVSKPLPVEPPDGSVLRFSRGGYNYVAVHRGANWETTSTGNGGAITQVMSWASLGTRVRSFDIATGFAPVNPRGDARTRQSLAVVRFTMGGHYLAAINVSSSGSEEGDWYTTVTDAVADRLPFADYADWSDISRYGQHVQVVSEWTPISP